MDTTAIIAAVVGVGGFALAVVGNVAAFYYGYGKLGAKVDGINKRLDQVNGRLNTHSDRLNDHGQRIAHVEGVLQHGETRRP